MTERRLARLLGLTLEETEVLTRRARARRGRRAYAVRLAALLIATAPVLRRAIPAGLRCRAIRPLVYELIPGSAENLLYARVRPKRAAEGAG